MRPSTPLCAPMVCVRARSVRWFMGVHTHRPTMQRPSTLQCLNASSQSGLQLEGTAGGGMAAGNQDAAGWCGHMMWMDTLCGLLEGLSRLNPAPVPSWPCEVSPDGRPLAQRLYDRKLITKPDDFHTSPQFEKVSMPTSWSNRGGGTRTFSSSTCVKRGACWAPSIRREPARTRTARPSGLPTLTEEGVPDKANDHLLHH